ncbi:complement factor H-like, partial [Clarias magur]
PCIVTTEDMDAHKITHRFGPKRLFFVPHQDHLSFKCQYGRYEARNNVAFRQQCIDG